MKLLQTTIRVIVWSSIFLISLMLIEWIGREVILNLPW